ncbi:MAG: hypothetical protein J6A61_00630 [Clostridia bacterium]|nr:hypothetical protein [Clostridia bacterium]
MRKRILSLILACLLLLCLASAVSASATIFTFTASKVDENGRFSLTFHSPVNVNYVKVGINYDHSKVIPINPDGNEITTENKTDFVVDVIPKSFDSEQKNNFHNDYIGILINSSSILDANTDARGNIFKVYFQVIPGTTISSNPFQLRDSAIYAGGINCSDAALNIYKVNKGTATAQWNIENLKNTRITYSNHSYAINNTAMTWNEAKAACEKAGGHLLTISSRLEQEYINNLLNDKYQLHSYWMGGYKDTRWKWITGEPFNYSNWASNEPNSGNNVVLQIYAPGMGESYQFKWDDTKGDGSADFEGIKRGYICEWDHNVKSNSTSSNAPIIKSIKMGLGGLGHSSYIYNLRYNPININKGSTQVFDILVSVDWKGAKKPKVYLTQGATVINENAFAQEYANGVGVFNYIAVGQAFQPDLPIYVVAVDEATGESSSMLTTLTVSDLSTDDVYKATTSSKFSFKLGKELALSLPEDLPIIGGLELSWEVDPIPITFTYENKETEKMCIAIGINTLKEKEDGVEDFSKQFSFKEYKEDIIDAGKNQCLSLAQIRAKYEDSVKKEDYKMSLFDGKILGGGSEKEQNSIDVLGYAEVTKGKDGNWNFRNAEGFLKLEIKVSYEHNGQIFLWVIPCYYTFGGSLGASLEAAFKGVDPTKFTPEISSYLTSTVAINLGAGVGVSKLATFGVNGDGSLNLKLGLGQQLAERVKVWLTANANVSLVVFGKTFVSKTAWELPEEKGLIWSTFPEDSGKNMWINRKTSSLMSVNSILETYSANAVYENESRDYLKTPMEWYGDMPSISLFAADYTNKNLTVLADSIYPHAQPQIFSVNGKKILVFTTDNPERTAENKQMLVYSVYDDEYETWSAPVAVWDDGTADFYPSVSGEYLVWQNQKSAIEAGLSLAEIGKQGEIAMTKWNGNSFDAPVFLTDNDSLDTLPKISVNGDEISAIWLKNSANDILGIDGNTSIAKKVYNGSVWGEEVVLKDNLNAVTDLSVGYSENALNVAYVQDADDDITTIEDREVYLIGSSEKQITDNEVLDSNAIINNGKLYWYSENNIHFMNISDGAKTTVFEDARYAIADGFTVSEDNGNIAILWSGSDERCSEIKGVLYQDGAWDDIITVSELGAYAKYPTCVLEEDGTILTSFTAESGEITSLYTLGLFPSYDLAITDVHFDEKNLTMNSENEFEVMVTNNGELPVDGYTINVYNEDETLNNSIVFDDTIKAGESKTVIGKFITGDTISYETLNIEVALNASEEYVYDNNLVSLTIGNGDISVEDLTVYEMLPTSHAVANIKNIGYSDINDMTVHLRADSIDGTIVQSKTISSLTAGSNEVVTFSYKPEDYENVKWYVTVEVEEDEVSVGNNHDYFINECAIDLPDYETAILNYSYADKQLTVNAFAKNNTNQPLSADAVFAVYGNNGKLKGVTSQPLSVSSYSDTGIDVWFENYTYSSGDYIKMFMWSRLTNLKSLINPELVSVVVE